MTEQEWQEERRHAVEVSREPGLRRVKIVLFSIAGMALAVFLGAAAATYFAQRSDIEAGELLADRVTSACSAGVVVSNDPVEQRRLCGLAEDVQAEVKAGPQGIAGVKGDKGDKGDPGVPGRPGASGKPGAKGDTGQRGRDGADSVVPGPVGPSGAPGADSTVPGPEGPQGAKGDTGEKGDRGQSAFPFVFTIPASNPGEPSYVVTCRTPGEVCDVEEAPSDPVPVPSGDAGAARG